MIELYTAFSHFRNKSKWFLRLDTLLRIKGVEDDLRSKPEKNVYINFIDAFIKESGSVFPITINDKSLTNARFLSEEFGKIFQSVY